MLVWGQASAGAIDVSSVTVDLSGWAGRTVTATLREAGAQGFAELPVTSSDGVFRFAATLEGREVLVLMLAAN